MNRTSKRMNCLRYGCAGLILIGFIGLAATMLPDYEYELWRAYLFAGIAMAGFAGQLVWALMIFADWMREKEHRQELFSWARRWRIPFAWLTLGGAAGKVILADGLGMNLLAGMCQAAAEMGLICLAVCAISLIVERQMKKKVMEEAS